MTACSCVSPAQEPKPAAKGTGAVVGYARTSTAEQEAGLAAQERELRAAGCERVFAERVSSVGQRPRLDAALEYLREGDVLMVTRPDRLARSVADLLGIVARLDAKGVALHVMSTRIPRMMHRFVVRSRRVLHRIQPLALHRAGRLWQTRRVNRMAWL